MSNRQKSAARDRFDTVDWDRLSGGRSFRLRTKGFFLTFAGLVALYVYDYALIPPNSPTTDFLDPHFDPHIEPWDIARLDWLLLLSLSVLTFYVVIPMVVERDRRAFYWRQFRGDLPGLLSFAYIVVFLLVGLVAPVFIGWPELTPSAGYQPPVGFSAKSTLMVNCVGDVVGGQCTGTWQYPLGTTFGGKDVLTYTVAGTHVAAVITLVASMIIVPLATVVGTTAAYAGGRIDSVLMRSVDVVQAIPPLFAYLIIRFVLGGGGDMVLLVGVFGLLSWGSAARVVRSETLQESEKSYVRAAKNVGAGGVGIVHRHLLPNVSTTIISTTAHQVSMLILTEAALSYLGLGAPHTPSWGTIIADGASGTMFGQLIETWWISVFPMLALAVTVVAISVFGDSLREAMDPRSA